MKYCVSSLPWTVCVGWPSHKVAAPQGLSSCTTSLIHHLSLPLSVETKHVQVYLQWKPTSIQIVTVSNTFRLNSHCHAIFPLLTSTQALKVLSKVKGSPWLLCRGWRAVAQSGLCCELRRKGDWTLRAADTVNTDSTRLNKDPNTSIFPEWTQTTTFTQTADWNFYNTCSTLKPQYVIVVLIVTYFLFSSRETILKLCYLKLIQPFTMEFYSIITYIWEAIK